MKNILAHAALLTVLLSSPALAQTPDHLVGFTQQNNLRNWDHPGCAPLGQCAVPFPVIGVNPPAAGGTGWDPVRSGAWVTDGNLIAEVDDQCNMICQPMAIPGLGNAFATGLEVVESMNQIWLIDNLGNLHFFRNTCPPVALGVCQTGLIPSAVRTVTTGLAVDEGNGLVFISYCDFATGANLICVSRMANPCQILCRVPVQPCPGPVISPFGTITGLAVNWGRQTLYATDGVNTVAMRYVIGLACVTFPVINCCLHPVGVVDMMVGLAVRPGQATSNGNNCSNGACPPCPMVHSLGNDPNLGNAFFRLDLSNAPAGSLAWCLFGTGPCNQLGPIFPPLCGPIFTPQPLLGTLGPNLTGGLGGGVCQGQTAFSFPLPAWIGLAGWTISSQCIVLCSSLTGGIGTSVSNCLSYTLQGN